MPTAEIITIGTELLLGEIQDTNTRYLAKKLKDVNIDLFRITMIGDNASRIAALVKEALTRSDIIITTGGLGPTVDDPTREAIALCFGVQTEFHPDLWQEIEKRFLQRSSIPTDNNRRQAFIPVGAEVIHNPVGTAPAFYMSSDNRVVICLPGVPREMEFLTETAVIPLLKQKYHLQGMIKARVIHLAGIGESVVDAAIGDLEKLNNPTVGLLAHPGIVDIRITAKADTIEAADRMISKIENQITATFPKKIFGYDDDSLTNCVVNLAKQKKSSISITSYGLEEDWPTDLSNSENVYLEIQHLIHPQEQLQNQFIPQKRAPIQVDCKYLQIGGESHMDFNINTNQKIQSYSNIYNGPSAQGTIWAINNLFEKLRQTLMDLE